MAYRLEIQDKVNDQATMDKYRELNQQAMEKIACNIDEGNAEEENLKERLNEYIEDPMNKKMIPMIKRHANKYHQKHDVMKQRAKEEHKKAKEKEYKVKGKGEWKVCKDMQKETAKPMIALKRRKEGPRGQRKGTITTKPKEIDEIIQQAYGEIYKGNVENPKEMKRKYLEEYSKYIHKAKQATIEPITGRDPEEAARDANETAAGPDQWGSSDPAQHD